MKKLLILLFSILISLNSYGEWKKVVSSVSGNDYYLDFDLIKSYDGYIYFWKLEDLLEPDLSNTLSSKSYYKINCALNSYITLSTSLYEQPMGRGTAWHNFDVKEWKYAQPNTVTMSMFNIACKYL